MSKQDSYSIDICPRCNQADTGQTGEYPCPECGLPLVHDEGINSTTMLNKKYPTLSFIENFLGGHINIGPITIFGENAMRWAVKIKTRWWGYICFRLPFRCFGKWWPLYFYLSPDATPWASTLYFGPDTIENIMSRIRRKLFGHNFSHELGGDFARWNKEMYDCIEITYRANRGARK